jgi:putative colanic acid biosynthesis glycosyltransferase
MLTVITVVLNDVAGLEKTLQSVGRQKQFNPNIQYIVVDGGSTDGSLELIHANEAVIDFWISGPDGGIYDAMNIGIRHAKGIGLIFMNAGDYFVGNLLHPDIKIPSFLPVKYIDILGRFRYRAIESVFSGLPNCHQGIIFENKGIEYDLKYKISSDYKYFLENGYRDEIPMSEVDGYVYFDNAGINTKNVVQRDDEIFQIRRTFFGFLIAYTYEVWPATKRFIRIILGVFR